MKVEKKRIGELNKCYSLAELSYRGEHCFLVAAEKQDPCYLFRESGELMEQVWDGPGGVMTMAEVPGTDGIFLATRRFYSPNDGLDAEIVLVEPNPLPCVRLLSSIVSGFWKGEENGIFWYVA